MWALFLNFLLIKLDIFFCLCSSLAWRAGGSIRGCNFYGGGEEGVAASSLGQHRSREPLAFGISSQLDSMRTSSPSSTPFIHIVILEPPQIWGALHYYSHCYWFATNKMTLVVINEWMIHVNFAEDDQSQLH